MSIIFADWNMIEEMRLGVKKEQLYDTYNNKFEIKFLANRYCI